VPDFNFAKGSSPREAGKRAGTPRQPAPSAAQNDNAQPPRPSKPAAAADRHSVLDKYPERDLSHLTGDAPPPPEIEDAPPVSSYEDAAPNAAQADPADGDGTNTEMSNSEEGKAVKKASGGSSNWPLIAIMSVVLLLVAIAFLWHVNPFPSVRESLSGLFSSGEQVTAPPPGSIDEKSDEEELVPQTRSWDYFLQVSSWEELAKADLDAERFRAQGLGVMVESEFIPRKRATFYRVRLGPYASTDEAAEIKSTYAAVIPADAFLDSTRLTDAEASSAEERPVAPPASRKTVKGTSRATDQLPQRGEFDVVNEPLSGYAVKVSSLKSIEMARGEARKLLSQGYPAFITVKPIGAARWYRVLVGPFSDKRDADRYMELLNVTYGNEAYTVNLSTY
jgi:cell division septation protein DedD